MIYFQHLARNREGCVATDGFIDNFLRRTFFLVSRKCDIRNRGG